MIPVKIVFTVSATIQGSALIGLKYPRHRASSVDSIARHLSLFCCAFARRNSKGTGFISAGAVQLMCDVVHSPGDDMCSHYQAAKMAERLAKKFLGVRWAISEIGKTDMWPKYAGLLIRRAPEYHAGA